MTIIKNGTIVTADLTYKADIRIENGTIAEIGPNLSGPDTLDASGCYVMPGGIDPHTHLEMPFMGTYSSDDFESGTRAALSGGTTMVVDFCLPNPNQSLLEALQMWDNKTSKASCDYSFHMAVTWWGEQVFNEMAEVVDRGITSFKHFMAYKGSLMVNDDEMFASFQRCADLGALPLVHAENGDVVASMTAKLLAEGNDGPEGHAYSRPPEVEGEATNRAIMIADMAGVPVYIVHTSCEQAHEAIRRARQKGMRVYGEPLIQHLVLDEFEYFNKDWDYAARRVMSPPFRNKQHQDLLWAGLQSGSLQVVATDHCAFTTAQKRNGIGNFAKIPNGTGGLEDRLPVLWTKGVATGRLTMNEFVAVTSTNIAKILGLYPKKGAVLVGADADLVVVDPKRKKTISAKTQQSAIDYNVFEGIEVEGLPRFVLSRGKVAVTEGDVTAEQGHGEFVARQPNNPVNRALSTWKEITAPRKIERTGIPATGGIGLPLRGGAAAIVLLASALAAPALADGTLPLEWAFGNAEGCHFYLTGRAEPDRMIVLTADTFTAPQTGCDFGELVSEHEGVFTVETVCSSAGVRLPGNQITVTLGDGVESYHVALDGHGMWGPLLRCPVTEQEVRAL